MVDAPGHCNGDLVLVSEHLTEAGAPVSRIRQKRPGKAVTVQPKTAGMPYDIPAVRSNARRLGRLIDRPLSADLASRHLLGVQPVVEVDLPIQIVAHPVHELHVAYVAKCIVVVESVVELLQLHVSRTS